MSKFKSDTIAENCNVARNVELLLLAPFHSNCVAQQQCRLKFVFVAEVLFKSLFQVKVKSFPSHMGPLDGDNLYFRNPQQLTLRDHPHGASTSRGVFVYFPAEAGSHMSFHEPRRDERLSQPSWLVTYLDGLPVRRRSPIQVLTGLDVD